MKLVESCCTEVAEKPPCSASSAHGTNPVGSLAEKVEEVAPMLVVVLVVEALPRLQAHSPARLLQVYLYSFSAVRHKPYRMRLRQGLYVHISHKKAYYFFNLLVSLIVISRTKVVNGGRINK